MKLFMLRHGATHSNLENRSMGAHVDEPLDAIGREEVRAALLAAPTKFSALYTSPMKRTMETAAIFNERYQLPIITRNELIEYNRGSLDGMTWAEIATFTNGEITLERVRAGVSIGYEAFGGETFVAVEQRVRTFLKSLTPEDAPVLAVTHSGVIRMTYHIFGKLAPSIPNASLHEFDLDHISL